MNRSFFGCTMAGLVVSLLFAFLPRPTRAEELSPETMEDILQVYDSEFLSSYGLRLLYSAPTSVSDKAQGYSTATVAMVGDEQGQYLVSNRMALSPISFSPGMNPRAYRADGSYLLSTIKTRQILLSPEGCRVRNDGEVFVVSQGNSVLASFLGQPLVEAYPSGHQDPANLFYRHLLPLGRGYSQLIHNIEDVQVDDRGLATVRARGVLFSPDLGNWQLEVDLGRSCLVRRAVFEREGTEGPALVVNSEGYWESAVPLAMRGSLRFAGDYAVSVTLTDYPAEPDRAVKESVRNAVNVSPSEGALIVDFGSMDGDGVPLVVRSQK